MRLRFAPHILSVVVVAGLVMAARPADAQSVVTGPVVTLDRYEFSLGDSVIVTIDGFEGTGVTISVCGNEARRGSSDCNMPESEGRGLRRDGTPTLAQMPVFAPPVPCPCVIRVSTANNDQVAIAPITIVGHPVAPVVDPVVETRVPLDVSIVANESTDGFSHVVRSSLGGASTYEVTVTLRNRTATEVDQVRLSGSAGRSETEELVALALPDPGVIAAGATWQETISAELPALTFGEVEWQVTASGGNGLSVQATDTTSDMPLLLILLGVVLFLDLLVLFVRLVSRGRRNRRDAKPDDNSFMDDPGDFDPDGHIEAELAAEHREAQLVN